MADLIQDIEADLDRFSRASDAADATLDTENIRDLIMWYRRARHVERVHHTAMGLKLGDVCMLCGARVEDAHG